MEASQTSARRIASRDQRDADVLAEVRVVGVVLRQDDGPFAGEIHLRARRAAPDDARDEARNRQARSADCLHACPLEPRVRRSRALEIEVMVAAVTHTSKRGEVAEIAASAVFSLDCSATRAASKQRPDRSVVRLFVREALWAASRCVLSCLHARQLKAGGILPIMRRLNKDGHRRFALVFHWAYRGARCKKHNSAAFFPGGP